MAFQNQVPMYNPRGFPGGWASDNVYYAASLVAGPNGVTPGNFVSVLELDNSANPDKLNPKRAVDGGANAIGIALRARIGTMPLNVEYQNKINAGYPVEAVVAGDARVALSNYASAQLGMKVFYDTTTGAPSAAAAGATVAGSVETDWYVYSLDAVDGDNMVKVSTFRKA